MKKGKLQSPDRGKKTGIPPYSPSRQSRLLISGELHHPDKFRFVIRISRHCPDSVQNTTAGTGRQKSITE